jgi:hypothetical protein
MIYDHLGIAQVLSSLQKEMIRRQLQISKSPGHLSEMIRRLLKFRNPDDFKNNLEIARALIGPIGLMQSNPARS